MSNRSAENQLRVLAIGRRQPNCGEYNVVVSQSISFVEHGPFRFTELFIREPAAEEIQQ